MPSNIEFMTKDAAVKYFRIKGGPWIPISRMPQQMRAQFLPRIQKVQPKLDQARKFQQALPEQGVSLPQRANTYLQGTATVRPAPQQGGPGPAGPAMQAMRQAQPWSPFMQQKAASAVADVLRVLPSYTKTMGAYGPIAGNAQKFVSMFPAAKAPGEKLVKRVLKPSPIGSHIM